MMMIAKMLRATLTLVPVLAIAGCGAMASASKASKPLDAYTLAPLAVDASPSGSRLHLVVELPASGGALATDRILIKPNPLQAEYLPEGRWVDPAPVLIQSLLVASLQNSGAFRLVGRDGSGLTPDFVLLGELHELQAEAPAGTAAAMQVHVGLTLTLVREDDRSLIATRRFDQTETAASSKTVALVSAMDVAVRRLLAEAVGWSVNLTR